MKKLIISVLIGLLGIAGTASAALLAYEGFDISGYSDGAGLNGATNQIGATSFGWRTGGSNKGWNSSASAASTTLVYRTTGLSWNYGSWSTASNTGGSAQNANLAGASSHKMLIRPLNFTTASSQLWMSYLSYIPNNSPADAETIGGITKNASLDYRAAYWDFGAGQELNGSTNKMGGAYVNGSTTGTTARLVGASDGIRTTNVTYMTLMMLDGWNAAAGATVTANYWLVDQAQYSSLAADGSITVEELNAATLGNGANQVSQRLTGMTYTADGANNVLTANSQFMFMGRSNEDVGLETTYDEIRIGETLNSIVGLGSAAYILTASAGSGGTVSPASTNVSAGGSANFVITARITTGSRR